MDDDQVLGSGDGAVDPEEDLEGGSLDDENLGEGDDESLDDTLTEEESY